MLLFNALAMTSAAAAAICGVQGDVEKATDVLNKTLREQIKVRHADDQRIRV